MNFNWKIQLIFEILFDILLNNNCPFKNIITAGIGIILLGSFGFPGEMKRRPMSFLADKVHEIELSVSRYIKQVESSLTIHIFEFSC